MQVVRALKSPPDAATISMQSDMHFTFCSSSSQDCLRIRSPKSWNELRVLYNGCSIIRQFQSRYSVEAFNMGTHIHYLVTFTVVGVMSSTLKQNADIMAFTYIYGNWLANRLVFSNSSRNIIEPNIESVLVACELKTMSRVTEITD